jgi:hypothetical protein
MKNIVFFILFLSLLISLHAVYSGAGDCGLHFLQLPCSPHLAGQANSGSASSSSPLNFFQNPASFDWKRGKYIATSQTMWFVDTYIYNIAFRNIQFDKSFAFGIRYMDYGKLENRLNNGDLIGYYYPMDLSFSGNYSAKILPDFQIGANLHFLYEKIDTSSVIGFSTDFGALYLSPIYNINIGLAFKNLGKTSKMGTEEISLPFTTDLELSSLLDITDEIKFNPCFKIATVKDQANLLPAIGFDVLFNKILSIHTGYKFNYNEEDFSIGTSIYWNNIQIDYSYLNNKIDGINGVSIIGIGYIF